MTNTTETCRMMSVRDIAHRLNCSTRTVYRLADSGRMPRPIKVGRLVRWKTEIIERWFAEDCPVPQPSTPTGRWKR